MLERETELIIQTLVNRTIGAGETITLQEALSADMPRGVKAYLRAEVVRWIERDFATAPSLRNVDRTVAGVEKLTRHIFLALADNYSFSRGEYLAMLDNAVHFLENYLCRPQWTLASFLYQHATSVSPSEIIAKLDYFADYEYFPKLLERALQKRATDPIELENFRTLLARIDDQVIRQHSARELAALTKPIYDFLLVSVDHGNIPIPVKPLLIFFDDKKMKIMHDHVQHSCGIRHADHLTLSELTEMIEDLYSGKAQAGQQGEHAQPVGQEPSLAPKTEEPGDQPSLFGEKDQATPTPHDVPADRDQKNIALSLTFAGLRDRPAQPPPVGNLPDLQALISAELRERVITSVFMNDSAHYDTIIAALNGLRTWAEASAYIDQLCEINNINPSLPELNEFSAAVRSRYGNEGNA
jgi:hypothetical protein